jgi:rhamnulokinase
VAQGEQVRHRELTAAPVVDRDRAVPGGSRPVEQHHRSAPVPDALDRRRPAVHGRDEDAAHALLLQHPQVLTLLVLGLVGVAQDHRVALSLRVILDTLGDLGEERVRHVEHDQAEAPAPAGPELASGATPARVATFFIPAAICPPFNTVYQLAAAAGSPQLAAARTLLLIPDLLGYWLTGQAGAERTNASTTQLLDARTGEWAWPLIERAEIPRRIFPPLRQAGTVIGPVRADLDERARPVTGLPVVAVGSHDTASAVAAVPAQDRDFAYISSGTWSLVGMELDQPVLTDASHRAGFTNEAGIDGRIRYLHNVTGLWLLQESMRAWAAAGVPAELSDLLARAAQLPPLGSVVDADDPAFLAPGDMPARICAACAQAGDPVPATPPEIVRCLLDSLALAYRRTIARAQELSGRHVDVIHMVGGGVRNELLCQLTADACGLPVIAGPVEAAALGNALVQARALGGTGRSGRTAGPAARDAGTSAVRAAGKRRGVGGGGAAAGCQLPQPTAVLISARVSRRRPGPAHVLVRADEHQCGAEVLRPVRAVQVQHSQGRRQGGQHRG